MNVFFTSLAALSLLVSANASADVDPVIDTLRLYSCQTTVELKQTPTGGLRLKFENLNPARCNDLVLTDASSNREINSYKIVQKSPEYTLSKDQLSALSQDCKLKGTISYNRSSYISDSFEVVLTWCRASTPKKSHVAGQSFQVSGNGNCKLMKYGQFSNQLVDDKYCQQQSKGTTVSYEFSIAGNCKVMINGQYANRNTDDRFCTTRH